jgi:hypothetical protein
MKNFKFVLAFCSTMFFSSDVLFAQVNSSENFLIILNENIIANHKTLDQFNVNNIKNIRVLSIQEGKVRFKGLAQNEKVLSITVDTQLEVKTQKEIKQWWNLPETTEIYVDKVLLENKQLKIATYAIKNIEILYTNKNPEIHIYTISRTR